MKIALNNPQTRFLQLPHKFRAFVSGYGGGKTWVGCTAMVAHTCEHPGVQQGYFAPTYRHIRDIFYPTIEEVAHGFGMSVKIRTSDKEIDFYRGRQYRATTIARSMDHPESIVGFKIGHAMVDELDVLKTDKAKSAWRKIIARMRDSGAGVKNGIDVTTTPEGYRFVYEQFVNEVAKKPELSTLYGIVQASTHDNAKNLPDGYIASLISSYPAQLREAYLNGQFINLTEGSVYPAFSRTKCLTNETIRPDEHLHVGMDFNVMHMAAVVHVIRDGRPYALDEIVDAFDTPQMIGIIKRRYAGRSITIYPDASGGNRKSQDASASDLTLLKAAGFTVRNAPGNPAVRDRILSVNQAFESGYWINPSTCPNYLDAMEKQPYDKNGEPDKSSGFDHAADAGGYAIYYLYPVKNREIKRIQVSVFSR